MLEVTCAIIIKDNLILATQRSASMNLPLKWEFPGGKIESGEDARDCIAREIREELNIGIRIIDALPPVEHDYGKFQIRLIPFVAAYVSGEIALKEHAQYIWSHLDELDTLDWAAADVPVVQHFLRVNEVKGWCGHR